ncbi:MAG: ATP-dependent helicase [Lachnospiraceae bacterium]|nr:ATP-dependent helicase [Lachnospiraceae bacterium]
MLSSSQKEAMSHFNGPCLTVAGPGSGKTTVLVRRIAHLILECKVKPENILVITFTRSAAIEMRERFKKLVNDDMPVVFGTFHSVFYAILKEEQNRQRYKIIDGKLKMDLIKDAAVKAGVEIESEDHILSIAAELSYMKNLMVDLDEYSSKSKICDKISEVYRNYEVYKRSYNYLDFDDMLSETLDLFKCQNDILRKYQNRFKYIMIDEIQDMNQLQFEVIKILALPDNNLFVVGDDDQSIYGFRGAKPEIMLSFDKIYPDLHKVLLGENYRSGSAIVEASSKLIENNANRFKKNILSKACSEGEVRIMELEDRKDEVKYLLEEINSRIDNGDDYEDIAILFRKHSQCLELVEALRNKNIPVNISEKIQNPYDTFVARDILCFIKMESKILKRSDLYRIMNKPDRGLTKISIEREWTTFEAWKKFYSNNTRMIRVIDDLERDVEFLQKLSGEAAINYILKKMGYDKYLREIAKDEEQYKSYIAIIDNLKNIFGKSRSTVELIEKFENAKAFMDKNIGDSKVGGKGVNLYTLHGAKGLEFKRVYIMDCNEGIMPSLKADTDIKIQEERRMFYVGITRAKENLTLMIPKKSKGEALIKSRFVFEMEL